MARTKKENKVALKDVELAIGADKTAVEEIAVGNGAAVIKVSVKRWATLAERAQMVHDTVDMLFVESDDGEEYVPQYKKFAVGYNILSHFTNINLPANTGKIWEFIETSDFIHYLAERFSYIGEVVSEIDELIEQRKRNMHQKSAFDKLILSVIDAIKTVRVRTEDFDLDRTMAYLQEVAPDLKGRADKLIASLVKEEEKNHE